MGFRNHRAVTALIVALLLSLLAVPITRAQAGPLYFPFTGHHLTDDQGFLGFWSFHDGERLIGYPVTEAFDAGGFFVHRWGMTAGDHGMEEALVALGFGRFFTAATRKTAVPVNVSGPPSVPLTIAEAGREDIGVSTPPPYVSTLRDEAVTAIRQELDADSFTEAWELGRMLTLDEAFALALGEAEPDA